MQRSGFFNAIQNNGKWDRTYNANDYRSNLAVVISNGVLRSSNDDLKVTASGMTVTVGVGRAWIEGGWYHNDTPYTFDPVTAQISGQRYDRIVLRFDNNLETRDIYLVYVQGEVSTAPVKPQLIREGNIYDIVLADIFVDANATSLQVTDTRADADLCGWVFSTAGDNSFFTSLDATFKEWFEEKKDTLASVTLFKRYEWRTVLTTASNTTTFSIPQYDAETCFIDVFVNGILKTANVEYTLAGSVLTFGGTLTAGTEVEVKCYKSIDGTGILTVAEEITQLQNAVAKLANTGEYEYICNGKNDNVILSQLAQAWLDGGTDYGCKTIKVYGSFGAIAAFSGSGTTTSPYRWIHAGATSTKNRKIILDFSNCGQISLPITAGTYNSVFYGAQTHIIGANVVVNQSAANTIIRIFDTYNVINFAENCRFWITAYMNSIVANTGTFTNCRASVANVTENSYCFLPLDNGLIRINGGEYYAYTGSTSKQSAIVGQSSANAVTILYGVNAPTAARASFFQTNSILQWTGGGVLSCTDLVSELPMIVVSGISNIRGTIAKSKAGLM